MGSLSIPELAIPTRRSEATTCGGPIPISPISLRRKEARSLRYSPGTV